jgi:hypothetical protein
MKFYFLITLSVLVLANCTSNKPTGENAIYTINDDTLNFKLPEKWLELQKDAEGEWTIYACTRPDWVSGIKFYTQEYQEKKFRYIMSLHFFTTGDPYIVERVERFKDSIVIKTDSPVFTLFKHKNIDVWALTATDSSYSETPHFIGSYIQAKDSSTFPKVIMPCADCPSECE